MKTSKLVVALFATMSLMVAIPLGINSYNNREVNEPIEVVSTGTEPVREGAASEGLPVPMVQPTMAKPTIELPETTIVGIIPRRSETKSVGKLSTAEVKSCHWRPLVQGTGSVRECD